MEGNQMKTREALMGLIDGMCFHCDLSEDCKGAPCEKMQKAKAALSAPPRNCDVGTAEEQYDRHDKYCNSQPTCRKCLREDAASMCISCFAKWAQMPYEAQEGGAQ